MKRVLKYYIITLLATVVLAVVFGGVFTMIDGDNLLSGLLLLACVQFAPLVGALFCKKHGPKLRLADFRPVPNRWLVLSILLPIGLITLASLILLPLGSPFIQSAYLGPLLPVALLTTVLGCTTEEIGWRGCMLHLWGQKWSVFARSLFTGLFWGAWHFFKISNTGFIGYLLFIPSIVLLSILMGFIYQKSGNSMFNMIVFHCFVNFSSILLLYQRESILFYLVLDGVALFAVMVTWVIERQFFHLAENATPRG